MRGPTCRLTWRLANAFLLFLLFAGVNFPLVRAQDASSPQEQASDNDVEVLYDEVLTSVFPRGALEEGGSNYVIILRVDPTFEANSQVVIVGRDNGIEVTEYTSQSGNIYSKLIDALESSPRRGWEELAKMIQVKKRTVIVPKALVARWRADLVSSVCTSLKGRPSGSSRAAGTTTVTLDGTTYNIWYRSEAGRLVYRIHGGEIGTRLSKLNPPLAIQINEIWEAIKSLPTLKAQ